MEALLGSIVAKAMVLTNEVTSVWIQVEQPDLTDYIYKTGNITVSDCGHQLWTNIASILDSLGNLLLPFLSDLVGGGSLAATQM